MAPQFVKAYVKSNKNDTRDAEEGLAEAVTRPTMRFVPFKDVEQQDIQALHRIRERLIGERTALVNEVHGLMNEYGMVIPKGVPKFRQAVVDKLESEKDKLTTLGQELFWKLLEEFAALEQQTRGRRQAHHGLDSARPRGRAERVPAGHSRLPHAGDDPADSRPAGPVHRRGRQHLGRSGDLRHGSGGHAAVHRHHAALLDAERLGRRPLEHRHPVRRGEPRHHVQERRRVPVSQQRPVEGRVVRDVDRALRVRVAARVSGHREPSRTGQAARHERPGARVVLEQQRPRGPAVVYTALGMVLLVLIVGFALTSRQPPPPTIAEFAPQAVAQITDTIDDQASTRGSRGTAAATPLETPVPGASPKAVVEVARGPRMRRRPAAADGGSAVASVRPVLDGRQRGFDVQGGHPRFHPARHPHGHDRGGRGADRRLARGVLQQAIRVLRTQDPDRTRDDGERVMRRRTGRRRHRRRDLPVVRHAGFEQRRDVLLP